MRRNIPASWYMSFGCLIIMSSPYVLLTKSTVIRKQSSMDMPKCRDNEYLVNGTSCERCSRCRRGEGASQLCTRQQNTQCELCQLGRTWSFGVDRSVRKCIVCKECQNRVILAECTLTSNAECGECFAGYFEDSWDYECKSCDLCIDEQKDACRKQGTPCQMKVLPLSTKPPINAVERMDYVQPGASNHLQEIFESEYQKEHIQFSILLGVSLVALVSICILAIGVIYSIIYIRKTRQCEYRPIYRPGPCRCNLNNCSYNCSNRDTVTTSSTSVQTFSSTGTGAPLLEREV